MISSHVKITCYLHMWRYEVYYRLVKLMDCLHFWGILNKSSSKSNVCHYFQIYVHNSTWESPIFVHCTCRNFICCSFVRLQNKVMSLCWEQWGGHFVPCRAVQSLTRLFTWLGEIKISIHTVKNEVCASKEIACYFFPWSPLPSK